MSTRPQIAMIHTLKSKLGIDDDNYRAMLSGFGVESSKDLSTADAKAFIESLIAQIKGGGKVHIRQVGTTASADQVLNGKARYAASNEVATYAQQAKIRHLWDTVSRVPESDRARALNNFLEKRFQISHLSWLPRERVGKVIHTLVAMQKQSNKEQKNV
jgi:hypothetical protein